MDEKLILFDVNGILCCKVVFGKSEKINSEYGVIIRPRMRDMIMRLSLKYKVGIYSSTMNKNIEKIIMLMFGRDNPFIIIADRKYTKLDPRYEKDIKVKSFDTIKVLENIWENPVLNINRKWNATNTLLIDHDYNKIRWNDEKNILLVQEFKNKDSYDDIDILYSSILAKLNLL